MSTDFLRNYIDIIKEAEQPQVQLDEGIMDTIKSVIPKVTKLLGGGLGQQIAQKVKQVTGGDTTPSRENAMKVAQAFGFDKLLKGQEGQTPTQVAEGWGIAPTWQGKLIQLAHAGGLGAAVATVLSGDYNQGLMTIGMLLLMFSDAVYGTDAGQLADPKQRDTTIRNTSTGGTTQDRSSTGR
jgi:hypothetical protein